jgi:hypothetical protein
MPDITRSEFYFRKLLSNERSLLQMNIQVRSKTMNSYLLDKTDPSNSMVSNLLNSVRRLIPSDKPLATTSNATHSRKFDPLKPLRNWLDNLNVSSPTLAHKLCKLIPSQCPFERDVNLFGHILIHIPPMCKLNPLYEEVVMLRFKAMCYLADECGEDISQYC